VTKKQARRTGHRPVLAPQPWGRLDRFEAGVLVALFALGVAPLTGVLLRVWTKGGVVTGADGFLVADPMQYLTWIREASDHIAVGNLYDLAPGPRSFVHPGVLISGLLHAAGLGVAAAYLAWKPFAVVTLFAGALALARRFLARRDDRRLAIVLALFFASPLAALVSWAGIGPDRVKFDVDFVTGELWPGTYLWGYLFTALAVGLLALGLLAYERGRADGGRRWLALAAACGLFSGWMQPWQGATFIAVIGVTELLCLRREPRTLAAARDLAGPVAAALAPLVYYLVLSRTDDSWELAAAVNDFPRWAWWVTLIGLVPLALPAAFAYRLPAPDFRRARAARVAGRGARDLLPAGGHLPVPRLPGPFVPAVRARGARAAGVARRAARAGRGGDRRRPDLLCARHRLPSQRAPRGRELRPPALLPRAGRTRRAA
jgi:hypothetical protein